jgi:hypothetical protein
MKTIIKTYLPVFTGFYNTLFECDNEDIEIDNINEKREEIGLDKIGYDDCDFNYKEYHISVANECVDGVEAKLKEVLGDGVTIKYESLYSPREYNFTNDSINVEIEFTKDIHQKIIDILKDNEDSFKAWVKEKHSSCDGFISWNSNNYKDWMNTITKLEDEEDNRIEYKFGAILGFILEQVEEWSDEDLYNAIPIPLVEITNYNELTTKIEEV